MEKRWQILPPIQVPEDFQFAIGGHPLVAQTLFRRGFQSLEVAQSFLNPDAYQPTPADALPDMDIAITLLNEAIEQGKRILVWGDFDVDGQTSTTTLVEGLRELGGDVVYHIPIRGQESHGITKEVLTSYLKSGFDLLLTCDTGISEHENIQLVQEAGIPVIVTDHHSLGESLPPAEAVLNPQRLPPEHPLRTLPGVGVAYKLMEGLFAARRSDFREGHFLELASLGIVADVAHLQGDTRYLLQKGLTSLRKTNRVGLQLLYQNAGLNPYHLNEDHIGFQIAPRMNAVGRLGDANPMVEFLTTNDEGRARVLATQIEAFNAQRRFATRQVEKAAQSLLDASIDDRHAPAIVLHQPDWPGGVVGIVASRLVEAYNKPAILLTGEDPIHGSARSVEGLNITEAIGTQAALLDGYGGHPMAAGLSLSPTNYASFKRGLLAAVEERRAEIEIVPTITIQHKIKLDEISLELIDEIQRLSPFGPGNPPLHFMIENLTLVSATDVGGLGEHRQVIAADQSENRQCFIWWNGGDAPLPEAPFDLVCNLSKSDYRGSPQINAEWVDFRLSEVGQQIVAQRQFELIDQRDALNPIESLNHMLEEYKNALVWGEGELPEKVNGNNRQELKKAETLIIWTAPPGQAVLQEALHQSKPRRMIIFGLDPQLDGYKAFMVRLGGLIKYSLQNKNGQTTFRDLAGACASKEETIRVGLLLWEAMGKIAVAFEEESVQIRTNQEIMDTSGVEIYRSILTTLLEESQAYRHYFRKGEVLLIFYY